MPTAAKTWTRTWAWPTPSWRPRRAVEPRVPRTASPGHRGGQRVTQRPAVASGGCPATGDAQAPAGREGGGVMKPPGIVARPARWRFAAAACGIALLTVACGSASSGSGAPSPPAPASPTVPAPGSALCADAAALRATLGKLSHVQAGSGAESEITADLTEV